MPKSIPPRLIFVRHGQTEWSKSGQYTSITDLSLTDFGVMQMRNTGKHLIGPGSFQMIKKENLKLVITSPRSRARQTTELLLEDFSESDRDKLEIDVDDDAREWDYGDYEGLKTSEIIALRKSRGLDKDMPEDESWNIWKYGCENGETAVEVTKRIDRLIEKVRTIHKLALDKEEACDILLVAHGHILRCLAARWIGRELDLNPHFMLDAGGVGVLSYEHHSIKEPSVMLTGAFVVPASEEGADI